MPQPTTSPEPWQPPGLTLPSVLTAVELLVSTFFERCWRLRMPGKCCCEEDEGDHGGRSEQSWCFPKVDRGPCSGRQPCTDGYERSSPATRCAATRLRTGSHKHMIPTSDDPVIAVGLNLSTQRHRTGATPDAGVRPVSSPAQRARPRGLTQKRAREFVHPAVTSGGVSGRAVVALRFV